MINRELYLKKIRPFMNKELVKVITGIRRCGKSVMLELIQRELVKDGVTAEAILTYNFESLSLAPLCTAEALYRDVMEKSKELPGRVYLFFDEVQEVKHWERAINSFRTDLNCDLRLRPSALPR